MPGRADARYYRSSTCGRTPPVRRSSQSRRKRHSPTAFVADRTLVACVNLVRCAGANWRYPHSTTANAGPVPWTASCDSKGRRKDSCLFPTLLPKTSRRLLHIINALPLPLARSCMNTCHLLPGWPARAFPLTPTLYTITIHCPSLEEWCMAWSLERAASRATITRAPRPRARKGMVTYHGGRLRR